MSMFHGGAWRSTPARGPEGAPRRSVLPHVSLKVVRLRDAQQDGMIAALHPLLDDGYVHLCVNSRLAGSVQ